jgi:hypothetical protein
MPASVVTNRCAGAFQHADPVPDRSGVTDPPRGQSDTDVLLLRVGSEPEQRIRRTSSHPGPTRKTTYYAE